MHRVELKAVIFRAVFFTEHMFLMHRVELKENFIVSFIPHNKPFLMHRVELKDKTFTDGLETSCQVPNAPCGVERRFSALQAAKFPGS